MSGKVSILATMICAVNWEEEEEKYSVAFFVVKEKKRDPISDSDVILSLKGRHFLVSVYKRFSFVSFLFSTIATDSFL